MAAAASVDLGLAHTAQLLRPVLDEARSLLECVFGDATAEDGLRDEDWEHCLGGMHVLARSDGRLVGHAALVQRRLLHDGRVLCTGYVEGVGVHPDWQRRGIGGRMMAELERMIRRAYDIGALGASNAGEPFYLARGWLRWAGPTSAMTPSGLARTPDEDGWVFVLPVDGVELSLHDELTCDYREGDVW